MTPTVTEADPAAIVCNIAPMQYYSPILGYYGGGAPIHLYKLKLANLCVYVPFSEYLSKWSHFRMQRWPVAGLRAAPNLSALVSGHCSGY